MTIQPPDDNLPHDSVSQSNEQGHNFNVDGQGNYVAGGNIHVTYTKSTDQLAMWPSDLYHIYLRKLLARINEYLTKKLLSTFQNSAEGIEPLPLSSQRLDKTVDTRYEKQNEIDPLFIVGGIANELATSYSSFHSAFEHYEGRILLLGEPGAGKTLTLLHFAREMVLKCLQDPSFPLPILAIIPTWNPDLSLLDWVANAYGSPKDAKQIIARGQALLLLDGLDELGTVRHANPNDPSSVKYDPRERFLQQLPLNNQIVVTCRLENYEQLAIRAPLRGAVRLEPLNDAQINTYLKDQPDMLAFVYSEPQIKDWLDTPLLLSLFAFAYADMDHKDRKRFVSLKTQNDFRDKIFNDYLRRRIDHERAKYQVKGAELDFSFDDVKRLLGQASTEALGGYKVFNGMSIEGGIDDDGSLIVESDFKDALEKDRVTSFLQFAKTLQLIVDTEEFVSTRVFLSRERGYRFYHLLLRNFFVFEYSVNRLMHSPNGSGSFEATNALGKLGDRRGLKALARALKSKHQRVKLTAIHALAKIDHPNAIAPLQKSLQDNDPIVRSRAIGILFSNFANRLDPQILINTLDDDQDSVLETAIYQIKELKLVTAIPKLVALLYRSDDRVVRALYQTFRDMRESCLEYLLKALACEDATIRANAALMLGGLENAAALDPLKQLLDDLHENVRYNAADALTQLGQSSFELRASILSDTSHKNWLEMAHSQSYMVEDEILPLIISALEDPINETVAAAANFFHRVPVREAKDPLIRLLHHESRWIRYEAIQALENYSDTDVVDALVKLLSTGTDDPTTLDTQIDVIEALGEMKNKRAAKSLIKKLSSRFPKVVDMAILALGKIGSKTATQPLISLFITTTVEEQQKNIIQALGMIQDRRAIEPLKKFLAEQIIETDIGRYLRIALVEMGAN